MKLTAFVVIKYEDPKAAAGGGGGKESGVVIGWNRTFD
jgi:hypothetical protein